MFAFLIRRLLQAILVMLAVGSVAFLMFHFIGDPIDIMLPENASKLERDDLRERLGLNDPIVVQYGRFILNTCQGEFGLSYRNLRPVEDLILERLPASIELVFVSVVISLLIGLPTGVYTALHRDKLSSQLLQLISLIGVSLPSFVMGILLILVFSVMLNWLPSFGRGDVVQIGRWSTGFLTVSGLKALILPSISLGLFQITMVMRLVRAEMLEVLRTDYIKFARARGLPDRLVHFRHALKNTLMPVITVTGMQIGGLIAFAIITETVFQWPGMGFLFIQAVAYVDIPIMSAYLVLIAFIFVGINTIVDLLYHVIDPRLRTERGSIG